MLRHNNFISKRLLLESKSFIVGSIEEALDDFVKSRLVIAMRLHALITAQLAGSPVMALSCDPKITSVSLENHIPHVDLQEPVDSIRLAQFVINQINNFPDPVLIRKNRNHSCK